MTQGNTDYAADITVWFQYEITSENDQIVISDTSLTSTTVTLDKGIYLVATDDSAGSAPASDFNYLLTHIETKLDAAVSNAGGSHTYSFGLDTPSSSSDYTNGGVSLSTSDSSDFTLEFSDSNFTAHNGIFGYSDILSVDQSSTSGTYTGQYTQWGRWQAPPNHYPQDVRLDAEALAYQSGGSAQTRGTLEIPPEPNRMWEWFNLPAAVVKNYRARDSALATAASLAQNDTNNSFQDVFDAGSRKCVIAYGAPSTNPDAFEVLEHEIIFIPRGRYSQIVSDVKGGEKYSMRAVFDLDYRSDDAILDTHLG